MSEQNLNLQLVSEIEKHEVLYNFRLPGYSLKDDTEKAWSAVSKVVHMSAADCKDRWKNLRAVFVRNMKPPKSGAGAKSKKAYYLLEAMQFAVPYIKALGAPAGNLPNPPQQEGETEYEEVENENDATGEYSLSKMPTTSELSTLSLTTTDAEETSQKQSEPSQTNLPNKKRAFKNEAVDKAFIDYFQEKKKKTVNCSNEVDEDTKAEGLKMFLLSMLPDLLKMSDTEVRQFKRNALDVVDNIFSARSMISPEYTSRSTRSAKSNITYNNNNFI